MGPAIKLLGLSTLVVNLLVFYYGVASSLTQPVAIEAYVAAHGGQEPPFIPLPRNPVEFQLGPLEAQPLKLRWEGSGPLPSLALEFVRENGNLPRHAY